MTQSQKLFSLQEANRIIPHLDSRVRILVQSKENCDKRHDTLFLHELITRAENDGLMGEEAGSIDRDFNNLESDLETMEKEIEEIRRLGGIVRDLETGYVEIPGTLDGEAVYFCWKLGEKSILNYKLQSDRSGKSIPIY